jgi:hypothetical protein
LLKETGPSKKHPEVAEQEPLPDSHVSMNAIFLTSDSACFSFPTWFYFTVMISRLTCLFEIRLHHEEMLTCPHHLTWCLQLSCILEFDGAGKGNPTKSGVAVIVRRPDGVCTTTSAVLACFLSVQLP